MADIVKHACITIAASSSRHPHEPFLTDKDGHFREVTLTSRQLASPAVTFKARWKIALGTHAESKQSLPLDPLESRAWALQERELSIRFASFTRGEDSMAM